MNDIIEFEDWKVNEIIFEAMWGRTEKAQCDAIRMSLIDKHKQNSSKKRIKKF